MGIVEYQWDGDDWQAFCEELLLLHHGGLYQPIPDKDQGDGGLEGHAVDGSGKAYQCFAPDGSVGIAERRRRQVLKIKQTVAALIDHRDRLAKIIGTHVVRDLVFLFPRHDSKEVNAAAREQEAVLRKAVSDHSMTWLDPQVTITVHTPDALLAAEIAELERTGARLARLPEVELEDADYASAVADELTSAREKLERRFGPDIGPELLSLILDDHLVGKRLEQFLADERPYINEDYERVKVQQRRRVERDSKQGLTAQSDLTTLVDQLQKAVRDAVAGLDDVDATRLAEGAVGSWLLECPLDFPATSGTVPP